jgi:hypothetical protein
VTKGWSVVAVLDDDPEGSKPTQVGRRYLTLAAANRLAELLRQSIKRPETVLVRTHVGVDDVAF